MATSLKTVAALALAAALSLSAAASASADVSIQSGGATGCCRMNIN